MTRLFVSEGYFKIFGKIFEIDGELHWHEWLIGGGGWTNNNSPGHKFRNVIIHFGPVSVYLYWGNGVDNSYARAQANKKIQEVTQRTYCDSGE